MRQRETPGYRFDQLSPTHGSLVFVAVSNSKLPATILIEAWYGGAKDRKKTT